MVIVILY